MCTAYSSSIRRSASRRSQPGGLERLHRPGLPLRTVDAGLAPALDDAEEPLADGIRDTPLAQPLVGQRQQVAQHQLVGRQLAETGPVQPRVDAVAGGPPEVLLARGEAHLGPDRAVLVGQHPDGAVVEGGVGEDVDDGRAGRQHAVLDAQVRGAADDVVDRPVPPVDGAVVQPQLGQLRGDAGLEGRHRVLVAGLGEQRREVADVLLEQVEDRGDPPLAEEDPGPHALVLQLDRAGVGGLREQLDPGLGVQPLAEEERASWRPAPPGVPTAPARRSSARRTRSGRPAGAAGPTCRPTPGRSSRSRWRPAHPWGPRCRGRCPHRGRRRSSRSGRCSGCCG